MAPVLKTGEPKGFVSSNLTLSATPFQSSATRFDTFRTSAQLRGAAGSGIQDTYRVESKVAVPAHPQSRAARPGYPVASYLYAQAATRHLSIFPVCYSVSASWKAVVILYSESVRREIS